MKSIMTENYIEEEESHDVTEEQPSEAISSKSEIKSTAMVSTQEEELDREFFKTGSVDLKKLKLNKGEKRALKFLMKRETGQQDIDINEFLKGQDLNELKAMLAQEVKKQNEQKKHSKYEQTGTTQKRTNNHSNKQWNFKDMMDDQSD